MHRSAGGTAWLSLTPEPERELPAVVAALRAGGRPTPGEVAHERARIERLVLHGRQRHWLRYLRSVVSLIESAGRDDEEAAAVAADVVANHHELLQGLPGRGAGRVEDDRRRLRAFGAAR